MVGLRELAGMEAIEAVLAGRVDALCTANELPAPKSLRDEFAPRDQLCSTDRVGIPSANTYDALFDEQVFA